MEIQADAPIETRRANLIIVNKKKLSQIIIVAIRANKKKWIEAK